MAIKTILLFIDMTTLYAFNKPYGVICQFSHHEKHPTLKKFIHLSNIYPAGRLDTDSEGLLLLTDDGQLQAKITHPKYKLCKTYWAQIEGIPNAENLEQFRQGLDLGDFKTQKAKIKIIETPDIWTRSPPIRVRKNIPDTWVEITIQEGKNRQVRRMCAKIGHPCLRLIRIAIGPVDLMTLELKPSEITKLDHHCIDL